MSRKEEIQKIIEVLENAPDDHLLERVKAILKEEADLQLDKKASPRDKNFNTYLENYLQQPEPMTVKEQLEYELKNRPKVKKEDILGKWPGDEPYELLMAQLKDNG